MNRNRSGRRYDREFRNMRSRWFAVDAQSPRWPEIWAFSKWSLGHSVPPRLGTTFCDSAVAKDHEDGVDKFGEKGVHARGSTGWPTRSLASQVSLAIIFSTSESSAAMTSLALMICLLRAMRAFDGIERSPCGVLLAVS